MANFTVPVAVAHKSARQNPKRMNFSANNGRATHVERLLTVTALPDPLAQSVDCNPGLPESFPWLTDYAIKYEHYRIRSVTYRYIPAVATSKTGMIYMYFDYNPNHGTKSEPEFFMQQDGAVSGPLYGMAGRPLTLKVSPGKIHQMLKWKQVRQVPTAESMIERDAGTFYYMAQSSNEAETGYIEVAYDIEFAIPQAPTGDTMAQATLSLESNGAPIIQENNPVVTWNTLINNTARFLGFDDQWWKAPDTGTYDIHGFVEIDATAATSSTITCRVYDPLNNKTLWQDIWYRTGTVFKAWTFVATLAGIAGAVTGSRFGVDFAFTGTTTGSFILTRAIMVARKVMSVSSPLHVHGVLLASAPKRLWVRQQTSKYGKTVAFWEEVWGKYNSVEDKKSTGTSYSYLPSSSTRKIPLLLEAKERKTDYNTTGSVGMLPPQQLSSEIFASPRSAPLVNIPTEDSHTSTCADHALVIGKKHMCITTAELGQFKLIELPQPG